MAYYVVSQAVLVIVVALCFRYVGGIRLTWVGLLAAFASLATCGPPFALLIYWFRGSRRCPGLSAVRLGVSMFGMVILYATAVVFASRGLGLPYLSLAGLPSYFAAAAAFGLPISVLTAYFVLHAQPAPQKD